MEGCAEYEVMCSSKLELSRDGIKHHATMGGEKYMNFQNEHKSAEVYDLFSKVEKLPEKSTKEHSL